MNRFVRQYIGFWNQPLPSPKLLFTKQLKLLATRKLHWTYCLILLGLISGIRISGLTEPFELNLYDRFTSFQNNQKPDSRLLIVAITEDDLTKFGWPISDQLLANTLSILQRYKPRVIGLDLYRHHSFPPGEIDLARQLQQPNLVAVTFLGNNPEIREVPPPQGIPASRIGFNDLLIDSGGVLRRQLLAVGGAQDSRVSFALRLGLKYWNLDETALDYLDNRLVINEISVSSLNLYSGGYRKQDMGGYQTLLHYQSGRAPGRIVTLSQVLNHQVDPNWITDRVVLIGSTAESLRDHFFTPYSLGQQGLSTMSGVVIHAQATSQILDILAGKQAIYRFCPTWVEWLWLWGWSLTTFYLVGRISNPLTAFAISGLLTATIGGIGYILLNALVWVPIAGPIVAVSLASVIGILTKLLYQSFYDQLTKLPNRETLIEMIQYDLRKNSLSELGSSVIVVFININRFKLINESLGYQVGDRLLLMVISRIKSVLSPSHALARVGGDEFAILFQGFSFDQVLETLNHLKKILENPFELSDRRVMLSASMGVASTQPGHSYQSENVLHDAQVAMYRAKATGKSHYSVFVEDMTDSAINRLTQESDLLDAIEKQEFVLHYQPIVNLRSGQLAGFETLLRWQKPEGKVIFPDHFISILEETGLITGLGQWIFDEACHQLQEWRENFSKYSELFISVNLSNRQFSDLELLSHVQATLKKYQVPGHSLRLEITESMIMEDMENSLSLMHQLKSLGIKLAIDDFGTGYSSLNYLRKFPVDVLKIDKSFVSQINESEVDQEIVETIINLGQKIGLAIVAEGVETKDVVDLLAQKSCEFGQGYFFSKPLSQRDATNLLIKIQKQPSHLF